MSRKVLAVLAGWLVLTVVVMAGFALGSMALGFERVLRPGSYDASPLWIAISSGITLVAALCAGVVSTLIGRGTGPARVLAAAVLVLGTGAAIAGDGRPDPPPRVEGASAREVMAALAEHGREPLVTRISNPLLGLTGILVGWASVRRRSAGASPPTP
ncbi:hypothetical protein [Engelhardtia mirabilis]|uniref:Uncharacterized protein n=1 Tax=Engelhardtia mirabilis TaxID=2528011 RepID=A0A518BIF0_9BACT|nr:hypothetical protein Pla133_18270 [Planctomycetes bacterium Pla133]QDV01077.1 hypothetical protein Pla86_18260 [Planctomycetes bacterium Pla86]